MRAKPVLRWKKLKKKTLKKVSPERITKDKGTVRPREDTFNFTMKRAKQLWIIQFHRRISFKVQVMFSEPSLWNHLASTNKQCSNCKYWRLHMKLRVQLIHLFAMNRRGGWTIKAFKLSQEVRRVYSKRVLVVKKNQCSLGKLLLGKDPNPLC